LKQTKVIELPAQAISEFSISDGALKINNNKTKTVKTYNLSDGILASSDKLKLSTSSVEYISPDKNKKLYLSGNQLWVDYLEDVKKEPAKKAGEKELVAESEFPIKFFNWFKDSEHLIWLSNKELTIVELDNRGGKRNSIKFYVDITPPVYWDWDNSSFYFFQQTGGEDILYKIDFGS